MTLLVCLYSLWASSMEPVLRLPMKVNFVILKMVCLLQLLLETHRTDIHFTDQTFLPSPRRACNKFLPQVFQSLASASHYQSYHILSPKSGLGCTVEPLHPCISKLAHFPVHTMFYYIKYDFVIIKKNLCISDFSSYSFVLPSPYNIQFTFQNYLPGRGWIFN